MLITMHQICNFIVNGHKPMYQERNYGTGRDQGYDFERNPDLFIQNDPFDNLSNAENAFHSTQLSEGRLAHTTNITETSGQFTNRLLFRESVMRGQAEMELFEAAEYLQPDSIDFQQSNQQDPFSAPAKESQQIDNQNMDHLRQSEMLKFMNTILGVRK